MQPEKLTTPASCQDDHDPSSLPPAVALHRIIAAITPLADTETIAIRQALGRVLAEDIISPINVPPDNNSAMDGYAVVGSDLSAQAERELFLAGTAYAGKPFPDKVEAGQCVRIMTGAVMPAGTDTVVMQEQAGVHGNRVRIGAGTKTGANVRAAGEDIATGEKVLNRGSLLSPAAIGLIASLGSGEVSVTRRVRVAFFSTGDELRSIGETLADGQIYDSNRYTLYGMLMRLGVDILDMGVIEDNRESLHRAFEQAAATADVLITTGGVSVGEADYVKEVLAKTGSINFWKIAIKPGRPLAFGRIRNTWFFGLPGNPVSVMVTFYQFVQPALRHFMGARQTEPVTLQVRCVSRLKKRPGRVEYQRGILEPDANGQAVVRKTGAQGSGILSSMSQANCFIILPIDSGDVEPDTLVEVQPFIGLV
ncbi:MAG: molybdopterin molybdotransferase MoeA [Gammaproteobacteria bacterium]